MAWPQFRPMPITKHLPYEQGAILRAEHRRLMMQRWRNPELRAEDRGARRLPQDWHDWMMCKAYDGYGTEGCTCDTWMQRDMSVARNQPRAIVQRERAQRIRLEQLGNGQRAKPREVEEATEAIIWVKTVDTSDFPPTLAAHEIAPESLVLADVDPGHAAPVRGAEGARSWTGRRAHARQYGVGLREPPWAVAASTHMSTLRVRGRQDR
jgi:hypothetical protein